MTDHVLVEHGKADGFVQFAGEPGNLGFGHAAHVEGFERVAPQFDEALAELIGLLHAVVPDIAELDQRPEQPVECRLGETRLAQEIGRGARAILARHDLEQLNAFDQGSGARIALGYGVEIDQVGSLPESGVRSTDRKAPLQLFLCVSDLPKTAATRFGPVL